MSNFIDNIEAVILANGDYPSHHIPLQILCNAKYVVCCDGGADAYIEKELRNKFIEENRQENRDVCIKMFEILKTGNEQLIQK